MRWSMGTQKTRGRKQRDIRSTRMFNRGLRRIPRNAGVQRTKRRNTKTWELRVYNGKFTSPYEEQGATDPDFIEWEDAANNNKTKWVKQRRAPLTVAMNDPRRLHLTGLRGIKDKEYIQSIKRILDTGLNAKRVSEPQKEYQMHHDLAKQRVTITFVDQYTRDVALTVLHNRAARNDTIIASVKGEENQFTNREETELFKTTDSRSRSSIRTNRDRARSRTPNQSQTF
jgi:hypothetical protein